MKKLTQICSSLLFMLSAGFISSVALGQTTSNVQDSAAQEYRYSDPFLHRGGAGITLSISEVSVGTPALMFWSLYQYRFSPLFAVEASANILHDADGNERFDFRTEFLSPTVVRVIPQHTASSRVAHSLAGNILAIMSPFDDKHLQIGLGASFRWAGLLQSTIVTRIDSLSQTFRTIDTQQFAIGVTAHAEYLFSLGTNIDLGVRLHSQLFLPPFAYIRDREPIGAITQQSTSPTTVVSFPPEFYGFNVGLGALLRIGF
jgi:hypothetical protein